MLTFAKPYFELYERLLQINPERNEGVSLFVYLAYKLSDFAFMQKQPSFTSAILTVERPAAIVHRNVHSFDENFRLVHGTIRVLKAYVARFYGLNLSPVQLYSDFERILYEIFESRFSVFANRFHTD